MQAAPKIGSILLGKYRVERVLGRGGMGFVVAARHDTLGELFAIKMMLPEALKFKDARERFVREARAAARLKSEHVARVHDVGTLENGAPYMLMEHLTGDDLKQILDKRGALPIEEAALYVLQACEAVAEAHTLGIAHRDLKPPNMFLTRRPNGSPCVKVLDFGISKEVEGDKVGPALTKTGMAVGTPVYMAPEQMANTKKTDLRSDIWSLGIILYELVIGKPPFHADAMTELVALVLTSQPVPPSQVRPGIPPEFDTLVLRCLEKNPDLRFATVRDFMTALQPWTTPATASLSQTVAGLQDPPAVPRAAIKDTTTIEMAKRAEMPSTPNPTIQASPLFATVPLTPDLPLLGRGSVPAIMEDGGSEARPGQTGGGWGGTSRIFSGRGKKSWVIATAALGGVTLLSSIAFVVNRSASSDESAAAASAAPAESAAPVASAGSSIANDAKPIPTTQEAVAPTTTAKDLQDTSASSELPHEKTPATNRTNTPRPPPQAPAPQPTITSKTQPGVRDWDE